MRSYEVGFFTSESVGKAQDSIALRQLGKFFKLLIKIYPDHPAVQRIIAVELMTKPLELRDQGAGSCVVPIFERVWKKQNGIYLGKLRVNMGNEAEVAYIEAQRLAIASAKVDKVPNHLNGLQYDVVEPFKRGKLYAA